METIHDPHRRHGAGARHAAIEREVNRAADLRAAGAMDLPHRWLEFLAPLAIPLAKLTVGVPAGMHRAVLLPQQRERHSRFLQLLLDVGPLRDDPVRGQRGSPKQARFQRPVIEIVGEFFFLLFPRGVGGKIEKDAAVLGRIIFQKMSRQKRDVFAALAQGRYGDIHDI